MGTAVQQPEYKPTIVL